MKAGSDAATSHGLAVFDLDGTITRNDTFPPYLRGWLTRHPVRRSAWPAICALARYVAAGGDRGRLKADLIRAWMGGASRAEVEAWTAEFVAGLGAGALYPGALSTIARHREAGDRTVLLSASVDLYVPAIGRHLGFDESLCTGVTWHGDRLDGSLATPNRRAAEKRSCIEALRGRFPGMRITAYANARSDVEHLSAVDRAVLVNAGRGLRRAALALGFVVQDWRG